MCQLQSCEFKLKKQSTSYKTRTAIMNLTCAFMGYSYSSERSTQLLVIASILLAASLPTLLLNGSIVLAIFKKNELKTPTYYIIGNLAVSDCLSGCFSFIFYALVCIRFAHGQDACPIAMIGTPWSYILGITTYSTISLQSIERYTAVFYPFWYHNHFTTKVALLGNLSTWLLSAILVTMWMATEDSQLFYGILGPLCFVCLSLNIFCYLRVFKEVKKIEQDMLNQQVFSPEERIKAGANSKVAKATAIILLTFVICYTPLLTLEFYVVFVTKSTKFADDALYWAWLLALINSTVNPLIACRQLKCLRGAVLEIFKLFTRGNQIGPLESFAATRTKTSQTDLKCF